MNPKELRARVDDIVAMADDDERAHSEEDQLREDVLRYIAWHPHGRNNHELAQIALSTSDVKFTRWCA